MVPSVKALSVQLEVTVFVVPPEVKRALNVCVGGDDELVTVIVGFAGVMASVPSSPESGLVRMVASSR